MIRNESFPLFRLALDRAVEASIEEIEACLNTLTDGACVIDFPFSKRGRMVQ
jgi:hypothetical protein